MTTRPDQPSAATGTLQTALPTLWLATGVALLVGLAGGWLMSLQPPLPGRINADQLTGLISLFGDLIGRLAGLGVVALLALSVNRASPRRSLWLRRAAQLWLLAGLTMTFANPTFVSGMPITEAFSAVSWWLFLTSLPSTMAWAAVVGAALVAVGVGVRPRERSSYLIAWLVATLAILFVEVTGNVTVGLDHDWATDAVGIATLAGVLLSSAAAAALGGSKLDATRYQHLGLPALLVIGLGYAVLVWQQLAGVALTATVWGLPVLLAGAAWVGLVANWFTRWVGTKREAKRGRFLFASMPKQKGTVPVLPSPQQFAGDLGLLMIGLASLAVMTHLAPPRFLIAQNIQINYLGYEVNLPATIERLISWGRPNLLWVALCVTAVASYLWGMWRLHRAGGRWPLPRLLSWLAGWGLMFYLATSGLWMYSTAVFSWHMLVHMTVNMMIPLLCVMGAPFTLIAEAGRHPDGQGTSWLADRIDDLASHRLVRVLLSPPLIWANYIFSLFLVYFSPLFPWLMRYHWGHQLMLLHFMIAGYAFFALVVGPDKHPWQLPYLVKFALLVSVMPFHAIFAVGIMMARSVLGEQFYESLAIPWVGDLLADQNIAGQITWFTGEIPAFIAVVVLAAQWFRSDSREAAASDFLMDADPGELDAYNQMLAELAERDRSEPSE